MTPYYARFRAVGLNQQTRTFGIPDSIAIGENVTQMMDIETAVEFAKSRLSGMALALLEIVRDDGTVERVVVHTDESASPNTILSPSANPSGLGSEGES
jgi:hypothetical protein